MDVCIKCFVYCHTMNKDVKELARQASEAPGGSKKGQCLICHSLLAVGPVYVEGEGQGEGSNAQWPSLEDTFPVEQAEASLSESELGRKLLQQWPRASQQTQVSWRKCIIGSTIPLFVLCVLQSPTHLVNARNCVPIVRLHHNLLRVNG